MPKAVWNGFFVSFDDKALQWLVEPPVEDALVIAHEATPC